MYIKKHVCIAPAAKCINEWLPFQESPDNSEEKNVTTVTQYGCPLIRQISAKPPRVTEETGIK